MEELLNELNEVIYVVDLESYELLYLNTFTLRLFGYEKFNEIKKQTCYEVFYKADSPCSFCNASRLTLEEYYEWECKNPLLNKYFIVKEKLLEWNGKNTHLVIAVDITEKQSERDRLEQTLENERIVLNCIKMMHSSADIDVSIFNTLKVMGKYLNGERTYIFELSDNNTLNNTYEWCAEGVEAEKEMLQDVPVEDLARWISVFNRGSNIIIENVDELKEINEKEYMTLYSQNIHSLVVIPIMENGVFHGFFGVDNPPAERIQNITDILNILSYFFLEILQRRKLMEKLQKLSYFDTLTGALNRNAFIRDIEKPQRIAKQLGVVFVDVNGLKEVNDNFGHMAGDELIINTFNKIKKVFKNGLKYRTGGDEFIVFCRNETEEVFAKKVVELKTNLQSGNGNIAAVGANWISSTDNINKSIKMAEINMYKDKEKFYNYQAENEKDIMGRKRYLQKLEK